MQNIFFCIQMCLSSLWTQPLYNDKKKSLLFFKSPKNLNSLNYQAILIWVNNQCSLPPSIPRLKWDPWARHRTPNCSPGVAAMCVCACACMRVRACVCAFGWVKCRAQIPSMGHHVWVWVCVCVCVCEKIRCNPFVILNIFISNCNLITHFFLVTVTNYNYFYFVIKLRNSVTCN